MTPKGLAVFICLFCFGVGTFVIAGNIGEAIDRSSISKSRQDRQRLEQNQAEWEREQRVLDETEAERIAVTETLLEILRYAIPTAILIVIGTTLYLYHGWSAAEVKKANFEATQIKMDPITRTYPIVCFKAAGQLRLHDPNTKDTIAITVDRQAIPLLVASSTAVQLQSMAKSNQMVDAGQLLTLTE